MQSHILPSRQSFVNRIELQCEYGNRLFQVVGRQGMGKSYVLETFVSAKLEDHNKAFVSLSSLSDSQYIITQLLEQSFLSPLIDFNESLFENFMRLNQDSEVKHFLWVIDNADFLPESLMTQILEIQAMPDLELIVLFSVKEPILKNAAITLHIEPLNAEETAQLVKAYYSKEQRDHPSFLHMLSEANGVPGILLNWKPTSELKSVRLGIPLWKYLVGGSASLVLLGSLYFELIETRQESSPIAADVEQPSKHPDEPNHYTDQQPLNADTSDVNKEQSESSGSSASTQFAGSWSIEDEKTVTEKPSSEIETAHHQVNETSIDDDALQQQSQPNATDSGLAHQVKHESEATEPVELNSIDEEQAPDLAKDNVKQIEREQQASQSDNKQPIIIPKGAPISEFNNLWYLKQPAEQYMLQLTGVSSSGLLWRFLDRGDVQKAKVYKARRNGTDWYVVSLGPYSSAQEALQARSELSEELQKLRPFPKQISRIQQEIKQNL